MPKLSRNDLRKQKYDLILQATKDSKKAQRGRDLSFKSIEREYGIKLKPSKKVTLDGALNVVRDKDTRIYTTKKQSLRDIKNTVERLKKEKKKLTRKELKNLRGNQLYKIARKRGYTPDEAKEMKSYGIEKFKSIINDNEVVNRESRKDRWKSMARRGAYDKELRDKAYFINQKNGFDVNDGYGWAVVYNWYILGYDIETWERNIIADPQLPDIYDDTKVKSLLDRL